MQRWEREDTLKTERMSASLQSWDFSIADTDLLFLGERLLLSFCVFFYLTFDSIFSIPLVVGIPANNSVPAPHYSNTFATYTDVVKAMECLGY